MHVQWYTYKYYINNYLCVINVAYSILYLIVILSRMQQKILCIQYYIKYIGNSEEKNIQKAINFRYGCFIKFKFDNELK